MTRTTTHLIARISWAIALLACPFASVQAETLSYPDMLDYLTDLDKLPQVVEGVTCGQFSSYDRSSKYDPSSDTYIRWDANADWGNYIRVEPDTKEGVMAEMKGPGCIFRIWSANPQGVIRFYLDGDTEPTYEWDFHELCTGRIKPFIEPLVWKRDPDKANSASNIYLPIPYAKSCKVTSVIPGKEGANQTPRHYYIINYRSFPEDWEVETFNLPLSDTEQTAVETAARKWANSGQADMHPLDRFASFDETIAPGESAVLAELEGPAIIRQFRAKLHSTEKWATRKVLLKAYWDGADTPAIMCPIGDFFGEPKDVPYKSYPMGITEESNYCFFPMPFQKSARFVIVNEGQTPAPVDGTIVYRQEDVPDDYCYFYAKWRNEIASTSFDYPLLKAEGTGKLVGICLFPDNIHAGWWGEGDEKVYVDGEKFPSWFGTGTEDYFGDAWGIRYFHKPSHGHPQKTLERMQGCYRWHLADNIPYYKSFYMTMENYTGQPDVQNRNDYSSVAYWYQQPGGSDFFEPTPVAMRIPRGYVAPRALEVEYFTPESKFTEGMSIVSSRNVPQPLSSGQGIKLVGEVGDTFTVMVPAKVEDYHVVRIGLAREVPASEYELVYDTQESAKYPYFKVGLNPIGIRFTGKPVDGDRCELIVDYVLSSVYRNMINEWLVAGPFPNPERKGFNTAYGPEEEKFDRDATYTGRDKAKVTWQRLTNQDGLMLLNDLFNPKVDLIAYGVVDVIAPSAGERTLLIGSDDGIKIWINDDLVWGKFVQRRLVPDDDEVKVFLKKGRNRMMVKIEQGAGDVGWAIRFLDPKEELEYKLPE